MAACEGRGREQQGAGLRRHVAARGGETRSQPKLAGLLAGGGLLVFEGQA